MFLRENFLSAARYASSLVLLAPLLWPQQISNLDRKWSHDVLEKVADDVRKYYYDPKFHAVNWDATIDKASHQIDQATSVDMALSNVAAAVDALNDSHTRFFPPPRAEALDFGLQYQIFGDDRCFVTRVHPGSDAEQKGVKPGDEVLTINGFLPERRSLGKMQYVLHVLRPQRSLRIRVRPVTGGLSREIEINATATILKRPMGLAFVTARAREDRMLVLRPRSVELGDELMILKWPYFAYDNSDVGSMIGKARKHKALVLDLRGNTGGSADTVRFLVSALFERETKIADRVRRDGTSAWVAKPDHSVFQGKLIVLVDSESASASELLARVVQLEKRGVVIGDRTAGEVMESKLYTNSLDGLLFAEYITEADLLMSDGKSLEHIGVVPDETRLPSPQDLASDSDPALARAAELAGVKLSPEAAGKLFPYQWPPKPQ